MPNTTSIYGNSIPINVSDYSTVPPAKFFFYSRCDLKTIAQKVSDTK